MVAWILSLMLSLNPPATVRPSLEKTAKTIANVVARESPLFSGPAARERTAAVLVATAWLESNFHNNIHDRRGQSYCLLQLNVGNGRTFEGWTGQQLMADPEKCVRAGLRVMQISFDMCRKLPVTERLAAYASGRCAKGHVASRGRVGLALKLIRDNPPQALLSQRDDMDNSSPTIADD